MTSQLKNLSPITVLGEGLPPPQILQNIPMLHSILEQVLEDWLRAVEPYQMQIDDAASDSAALSAIAAAFMELQPSLLKSLFSYAFFFVATDDAYEFLYSELNRANNLSGVRLPHSKPPRATPFVKKVRTVRNIAIAHFPSERSDAIDSIAAMTWQPMALSWNHGTSPDLEKLTFIPGRLRGTDSSGQRVQSQDLEIPGVRTMHLQHCLPYLERYDKVCRDYLIAIKAAIQ